MTDRPNQENVILPLSLTKEEKEQFADFCKNQEQTMSGRIKQLMRKDMGMTALSPYKEKYQKDIIDVVLGNSRSIIVKSRQMFVSTLLLSIVLHQALDKKRKNVLFISCNSQSRKRHMQQFSLQCEENSVGIERKSSFGMELDNGVHVSFQDGIGTGFEGDLVVFDEFAFQEMDEETMRSVMTATNDVVVSSTPFRGSLFNKLAIEAVNGQNEFKLHVAHWPMNSLYQQKGLVAVPVEGKDGVSFTVRPCGMMERLRDEDTYLQEMECRLF